MSLINKVAIVTGGSSGIGAAIAIKFVKEGARVVIIGRNQNKLKMVSDTCEKIGTKPLTIVADVTKEAEAKKIVTETINYFGKIDILVNNAGIVGNMSILESGAMEFFDKIMAVNLYSVVRLTHHAAKHLVKSKGNIINISSVASLLAFKNHFAYCTSKAALDHFSRSIALELGSKGVRVNNVNPGPVRTDIFDAAGLNSTEVENVWESLKDITVLNRVADSEEVADLVAFVASDRGRSITGATFLTDNGSFLKGATETSSTSN